MYTSTRSKCYPSHQSTQSEPRRYCIGPKGEEEMGVLGLASWIKNKRPETLNYISKRFSDPRVRNKRVAIDATLLTNQFHFASKDTSDEPALVKWLSLIKEMRAAGVKPIAVWDERGTREWKAAEAQRRLSARAVLLTRRDHEEKRVARLQNLLETLQDFTNLPTAEQDNLRDIWVKDKWTRFGPSFKSMATLHDQSVDETEHSKHTEAQVGTSTRLSTHAPDSSATPALNEQLPAAHSGHTPEAIPMSPTEEPLPISSTAPDTASPHLDPPPHPAEYPLPTPTSTSEDWTREITGRVLHSEHLSAEISSTPIPVVTESQAQASPSGQAVLAKLSGILDVFQANDKPYARATAPGRIPEAAQAIKHIRDLEVFTGEAAEGGMLDAEPSDPTEDSDRLLTSNPVDEHLTEMLPLPDYNETPRQLILTRREGWIIESLIGVSPPDKRYNDDEVDSDPQGEIPLTGSVIRPSDGLSPNPRHLFRRLASLREDATEIKESYGRALALPTRQDHDNCKELLIKLGVPVITAMIPYEAEGLASSLAKKGLVDFVGTEDSDVLAYEGPLLRHLGNPQKPLVYISGQTVRTQLDLTPEQYLDFCVLMGTDASPRISGVGPVRALKLIQQYSTIENILSNDPKIAERVPEGYMEMVENARKVFTDLPPVPEDVDLEQGVWNEGEVFDWMEERHSLHYVSMTSGPYQRSRGYWKRLHRPSAIHDDMDSALWDLDGVPAEGTEPDWEELVKVALEEEKGFADEGEGSLEVDGSSGKSRMPLHSSAWDDFVNQGQQGQRLQGRPFV